MSDFWEDDAIPVKTGATSSFWEDDALEVASGDPASSPVTAATTGLLGGASLGLADEIGAIGSTGMELLSNPGFYLGDTSRIERKYEADRNSIRKDFKQAEEANPEIAMAANIVGSFPTGGAFSGGKTLAARAGKAATGGAVSGFGTSEADSLSGLAADTGIGAGMGAAFQVGGEKIISPAVKGLGNLGSKALAKGADALDWSLKKAGKIGANVPEEVTERYLNRSAQINSALSRDELVDDLLDPETGVLKSLRDNLGEADTHAWDSLSADQNLDAQQVKNHALELIEDILGGKKNNLSREAGVGASADKVKAVNAILDQLDEAYKSGNLSESDLKAIVQDLQAKAFSDAGSPRSSIGAEALRSLSGKFNDVLKSGNQEYSKRMQPVQEMTRTLKDAERLFVNQASPGSSVDKASRALDRISNPKNQFARDTVENIDRFTGGKLKDSMMDTLAAEAFEKGDTNGSRKTMLGAVLGKAVVGGAAGYSIGEEGGAGIGAVAGFGADRYAGRVFKGFLDGRIKGPEIAKVISAKLGKFAGPLLEAAKRGNHAVSATHFIMMQRDPSYREAVKAMEAQDDDKR